MFSRTLPLVPHYESGHPFVFKDFLDSIVKLNPSRVFLILVITMDNVFNILITRTVVTVQVVSFTLFCYHCDFKVAVIFNNVPRSIFHKLEIF